MAKRLHEYVKYTTKELDENAQKEGSCVRKVNTTLHLSLGPFCLSNFKHELMVHILRCKIGFYDIHLDGIILDVKKIKVLGTTGAIRADDPKIHIDINADVYIFKPEEDAILTGVVKHIGPHQVGVILYRVFNANLRVAQKVDKSEVQMDQEVKFRIRKYNLQNVYPYIEGELLTPGYERTLAKAKKSVPKQEESVDSDIEEKDGVRELDDLLSIIKTEAPSEFEDALEEIGNKKSKKKKRTICSNDPSADSLLNTTKKKTNEKRKRSASISSSKTDDGEFLTTVSPNNIKQEPTLRINESLARPVKKIEGELLSPGNERTLAKAKKPVPKQEESGDSDIEEKDGVREVDDLLSIIKTEAPSEFEDALEEMGNKKSKNKKRTICSNDPLADSLLKPTKEKRSKKRKRSASTSSSKTDDGEFLTTVSPKNIKQDPTLSINESLDRPFKKIKDNVDGKCKKRKTKSKLLENNVQVKEEIEDDDYITST